MTGRTADPANIVVNPYGIPKSNLITTSRPARDNTGFAALPIGDDTIRLGKGYLFIDGNSEFECDPGDEKTISAGATPESLWVTLNTDNEGLPTGPPTVEWLTTPPTGMQKHREPDTDSDGDPGQPGKYAWEVMMISNSGGDITIERHCHAIFYYSDRSRRNWPDTPSVPPPPTHTSYYSLCVDPVGDTTWTETVTPVGSSSGDPSVSDLADGQHGVHKNTTSGNVWHAYNDGGVIKKVQMV